MKGTRPQAVDEPTDPDVDLHIPAQRQHIWAVLAVVSAGGAIGACARYGASLLWPTAAGAFPWTTLGVNAAGCALIGVFMVLVTEMWSAHPLLRPFVGTGVLGGFTTFSTYAIDVERLADGGDARAALGYLALTVVAALAAVWVAASATRQLVGGVPRA